MAGTPAAVGIVLLAIEADRLGLKGLIAVLLAAGCGGLLAFAFPYNGEAENRLSRDVGVVLVIAGFLILRAVDRMTDAAPLAAMAFGCAYAVAVGWLSTALGRFVIARHRIESTAG